MIERKTIFSPDRLYRYTLWREWGVGTLPLFSHKEDSKAFVQFIGLNPSTADETKDDPTIRRCIAFAKTWGYGALCMTNLFAWRETDSSKLKSIKEPIGPENDHWLTEIAQHAGLRVAAWGSNPVIGDRGHEVRDMLSNVHCLRVHCLRKTKDGSPEHPLYLPKTLTPIQL